MNASSCYKCSAIMKCEIVNNWIHWSWGLKHSLPWTFLLTGFCLHQTWRDISHDGSNLNTLFSANFNSCVGVGYSWSGASDHDRAIRPWHTPSHPPREFVLLCWLRQTRLQQLTFTVRNCAWEESLESLLWGPWFSELFLMGATPPYKSQLSCSHPF